MIYAVAPARSILSRTRFATALLAGVVASAFCGCSSQVGGTIETSLQCAQLYELKKTRLWGDEVGNDKYRFDESMNTCIALNIHNDSEAGRYFAMVVDLVSDRTLLYYSSDEGGTITVGDNTSTCAKRAIHLTYAENGKEIKESGCDRTDLMDRMFEKVKSFGFKI